MGVLTQTSVARARQASRPKMAVLLAEAITEDLIRAGVKAGTTLPPEAVMMRQYDVGRATVREALRLLEARGLIEVRPGRSGGPVVRDLDPSEFTQALALLLHVSDASVGDVVESREAIEPALAAKAALRRTEDDLRALRVAQRRVGESIDDAPEFSQYNREFHSCVARASGNAPMSLFWQAISLIGDGHVAGVHYRRSDRVAGAEAHDRLVEAIAARDAERAATVMSRHLAGMHGYMRRYYPAVLRRGVSLLSHHDL